MSKLVCVKNIVSSSDEYLNRKSKRNADLVTYNLQEFCKRDDSEAFDPYGNEAPRLYLTLHELVSKLDCNSVVLWAAIKCLHRACKIFPNHSTLVEAYKFIPPLAALLSSDISRENKICLLHLLLELTKDIRSFQKEISLMSFMEELIKLIITDEVEVVHISLVIWVNICENNPTLVYSLKRFIDRKIFHSIMNLQTDRLDTKVQICKLLFILEPISLSVGGPPGIARQILDITFSNFIEAFQKGDLLILNSVVDFFSNLTHFSVYTEILYSYDRWEQHLANLLSMLKDLHSMSSCAVLRFLTALVNVNILALQLLLPSIAEKAVPAISKDTPVPVCKTALHLLDVIIQRTVSPSAALDAEVDLLHTQLPEMFELWNASDPLNDSGPFISLMELFEDIMRLDDLYVDLLSALSCQKLAEVFSMAVKPLLEVSDSGVGTDSIHHQYLATVCVQSLALLCTMALRGSTEAAVTRDTLWQEPDSQTALAVVFYEAKAATKAKLLEVASRGGLPPDSAAVFAKSLTTYQQRKWEPNFSSGDTLTEGAKNLTLSQASGGQIDTFINELERKLEHKKSIPVSMAMTLYEYKLAAATRNEQALCANLSLAQNSCCETQQHIEALDKVIGQQRQLLFGRQQESETLLFEVQELRAALDHARSTRKKDSAKFKEELSNREESVFKTKQLNLEVKNNMKALCEVNRLLESELTQTQDKFKATVQEGEQLSCRILQLEEDLKKVQKEMSDQLLRLKTLKNKIEVKEAGLNLKTCDSKDQKKMNVKLSKEVADLKLVYESLTRTAAEKDADIQKLKQELSKLKRVRDMITSIAGEGI